MVTEKIKLAYIAGIVDGEGYISITKNACSTCVRGYRHRVQIVIVNTDLRLINRLKNWFGGHIEKIVRPEIYRKQAYSWKMWAVNEQLEFLNLVEPHLFIKRINAQICIDFLENGAMGFKGLPITKEEWERRETLCKKIQYINQRHTRLASETKREKEE